MERFLSIMLVIICIVFPIVFICLLCRVLYNWNNPSPPLLHDVEFDEESMTWREVE